MTQETGKCCDCQENKSLDEMVHKDGNLSLYHCRDCETEERRAEYIFENIGTTSPVRADRLQRLLGWCFG